MALCMRKKLIMLLFVVLGSISAISACGGPGDECSKDEDCCSGHGFCVPRTTGGSPATAPRSREPGEVSIDGYNRAMKPGDVLAGRFEIDRISASGGMGVVYRGFDRDAATLVAIKSVRSAASDAEHRFVREAEILAGLRHPGIVTYLGHGRADDELYLVMEWLEGEDLAAHLAVRDMSVGESIAVAAQIAAALAFLHARGLVHRDIKPSNVFLVDYRPDRVKLLDFGVARRAGIAGLTASGVLLGTPAYMAPEQARGRRDIDARADVYALGAVLFRCLAGRPPYEGDSLEQVIAQLLHDVPPRVRELVPSVPPALDALVARMLAKDPARRPADGAAVSAALLALDATSAASPAVASSVTPSVVEPPLVGRAEERATIRRTLDECDRGTLLLFTGDPGIGKTRLLHECAGEVIARGGVVAFGRAFEGNWARTASASGWSKTVRTRVATHGCARLGHLRQQVAQVVGAAPLPRGAGQRRADRGDQAAVGVGDDQPHPGQAAGGQASAGTPASRRRPRREATSRPRTSRPPSALTPTAIRACTLTVRPCSRTLMASASIHTNV